MHHALTFYPATHIAYIMTPALTTRVLIRAGSLECADAVATSIARQAHESGTIDLANIEISLEIVSHPTHTSSPGRNGLELDPVFAYVD